MDKGHFYYINDQYFTDFPDTKLMQNKENINGQPHDRNMCPITPAYIKNEYIDTKANVPVRVNGAFERELLEKAKRVLALQRKGIKLIFPDVLAIESKLLKR